VLIDGADGVIAGHGRLEAAKLLDMTEVPTLRFAEMSEAEKRAYIIADNRLAERAGWDEDLLAFELRDLSSLDLDFDLEITGFETAEIDSLIGSLDDGEKDDEADRLPPVDEEALPVSRPGNLWLMGPHRLLCGDATQDKSYATLLEGRRARMVFTDPPYNVPIAGHVSGLGKVKHRDFVMASGEMSEAAFTGFLESVFRNLNNVSMSGAIHFICMDWRHLGECLTAGNSVYAELKNICVWAKDNGGMGSFYRSQHELVLVFKSGKSRHINNIELGRYGRNRSNVWRYAGANSFDPERRSELALHPTVKPVRMVADAILDCSRRGDLVLDPFAGSGTVFLAAERTGRIAAAMELAPLYADLCVRRWQDYTGEQAVNPTTGQTFNQRERSMEEENGASGPMDPQPPKTAGGTP